MCVSSVHNNTLTSSYLYLFKPGYFPLSNSSYSYLLYFYLKKERMSSQSYFGQVCVERDREWDSGFQRQKCPSPNYMSSLKRSGTGGDSFLGFFLVSALRVITKKEQYFGLWLILLEIQKEKNVTEAYHQILYFIHLANKEGI